MKKYTLSIICILVIGALTGCTDSDSDIRAVDTLECWSSKPCTGGLVCELGRCVLPAAQPGTQQNSDNQYTICSSINPCPGNQVCLNGTCIALGEPECSVTKACVSGLVCNISGQCVAVPTTQVYEPECSALKPCASNQICDITGKCVSLVIQQDPECSLSKSCPSGQVCTIEGKCISTSLPVQDNAECSVSKPCANGGICNVEGKCVSIPVAEPECSQSKPCGANKTCQNGVCVDIVNDPECSQSKPCGANKTCQNGVCVNVTVEPECSSTTPCPSSKHCDNGVCVDDVVIEKPIACSKTEACPDGLVCRDDYCVSMTEAVGECWFYKECDPSNEAFYPTCIAKNKLCDDPKKQCNSKNKCIDRATADGVGLGESCSNNVKCASDLLCLKGVCRESSYAMDGQSCTANFFEDRCVGNIILECDADTGRVQVQDCKTSYIDFTIGSTGIPYGPDYVCAKRPGSRYVGCFQVCDTIDAEKFVCGWDLDDYDIDYSDRYVCKANEYGIKTYFPIDSETCQSTCGDEIPGKCDSK